MSQALIILFAIINGLLIYDGLRKRSIMGVFRFPFIIACVNLTFIYPQLTAIAAHVNNPDVYLTTSALHMCLCTVAVWAGFAISASGDVRNQFIRRFNTQKIIPVAILFLIIGVSAYLINRGVYKGGKISGPFVIVNFFTAYINYALILIMMALYLPRKKSNAKILLFIVLVIAIDQFINQARRANALYIAMIIGYFYMLHCSQKKYALYKYIIPGIFLFGMLFNTVIAQYRENAYSGEVSAVENVESLDFGSNKENESNLTKGEVNNAILAINLCENYNLYDYGASNWNRTINDLVPKFLVGSKQKQQLLLPSAYDQFVSSLTKSGSTMTGYFDSYASFGLLGFIKFFIIALIMGALWKRRAISDITIFLYLALLTPGIHAITHSTNAVFSALIIYAFFVFPILKAISKNIPYCKSINV